MKKKLLYIDPNSYSNMEIYGRELLSNIKDFEILFWGHEDFRKEGKDNFKYYDAYSYNKKKNKIHQLISYIITQIKLVLFTIKCKPKIIHVQWLKVYYFDVFIYRLLKKISKAKLIFTAHNILPHDTGNKYYNEFKKMYLISDGIIIHTENSLKELKDTFLIDNEKIRIIEHGLLDYKIDKTRLHEVVKILKSKLGVKNNSTKYLLIGKVHFYKGYDIIINTWLNSQILNNNNDFNLIIAGRGYIPEFDLVKDSKNIHLLNEYLTEEDFVGLIHFSDAVLFPYREISQSGVLAVVLNEKRTPLVTNTGGLAEPLKIGNIGEVLESLDQKQIENSLVKFSRENRTKSNLELDEEWNKIHKYYSWSRIGMLTENFYKETLTK